MKAIGRLFDGRETIVAIALLLMQGQVHGQGPNPSDRGYMHVESGGVPGEAKKTQLARALTAGPRTVVGEARIIGVDAEGKTIVLREGSNGFVCQPGNPEEVGRPASCSNAAALQWIADLAAGRPSPTNKQAGFIYMLAGATERDASGSTRKIGPQWMIIWPFDPKQQDSPQPRKTRVPTSAGPELSRLT